MKCYRYSNEVSPEEHRKAFEALKMDENDLEKIMNPSGVDEAKWEKAKQISKESYGELRYPFIMYLVKHRL